MKNPTEILALLHGSGLCAEVSVSSGEIVGGRSFSELSGFRVYERAFNISFGDDGCLVRLDGDGQLVKEVLAKNNSELISILLEYCR